MRKQVFSLANYIEASLVFLITLHAVIAESILFIYLHKSHVNTHQKPLAFKKNIA